MLDKLLMTVRCYRLKKKVKQVGTNLIVYGKVFLTAPDRIVIGNDCKINEGVVILARGGVQIGNGVTLSNGCKLITSGYDLAEWKQNNKRVHHNEEIVIGDNVWVCANAVILPGVHITGNHVVIAAGAVVSKNVEEDNCIVAGVPATVCKRF